MKSKIYKSLLAFIAIGILFDWPVSAEAINGKAVSKGLFKGCENSAKEMHPNYNAAAASAMRRLENNQHNQQNAVCYRCNGTGQIIVNGVYYYCPDCN